VRSFGSPSWIIFSVWLPCGWSVGIYGDHRQLSRLGETGLPAWHLILRRRKARLLSPAGWMTCNPRLGLLAHAQHCMNPEDTSVMGRKATVGHTRAGGWSLVFPHCGRILDTWAYPFSRYEWCEVRSTRYWIDIDGCAAVITYWSCAVHDIDIG
jgi:hypothetical protein